MKKKRKEGRGGKGERHDGGKERGGKEIRRKRTYSDWQDWPYVP